MTTINKGLNMTIKNKVKKTSNTCSIVSWQGNLHVACLLLNSNENSKVKDWAYKEIMKAGKILDQLNEIKNK